MGFDGRILVDADGKPVVVEEGDRLVTGEAGLTYVVRKDGTVVSPDGKLLLGPDGKPFELKPNEKLVVGDDGRVYVQRADGTLVDVRTGKPVRRPDGKPLIVPEG